MLELPHVNKIHHEHHNLMKVNHPDEVNEKKHKVGFDMDME